MFGATVIFKMYSMDNGQVQDTTIVRGCVWRTNGGRDQRHASRGQLARGKLALKDGNGRSKIIDVYWQLALEPKGNHVDSHTGGRKDSAENAEILASSSEPKWGKIA